MTTVTLWWSRRSSRATAVVCSGRKRPQDSNGQWDATPSDAALVGGGHEAEQELGAGVVEGREAEVVDDHEVGPQQALDEPPDAVVGEAAVERLGEAGRREVADPEAGLDRGMPEGDEEVALAGARRSHEDQVLPGPDPLERGEVVEGRPGDGALGDRELVERLCAPGTPRPAAVPGRWRRRGRASSASSRVRSSSSGAQRWAFAVTSTSGASRRTAASLSRRRAASRSGARGAGVGGRSSDGLQGIGRERADRDRRQLDRQLGPGGTDGRHAGSRGEDRAHVGRPKAAEGEARSRAPRRTSRPWARSRSAIRTSSPASLPVPPAAAARRNASATGPSDRNAISAGVRGRIARTGGRAGRP